MTDRFTKGFDAHQHRLLRTLYGDLVPPLEMISVRAGWYGIVDRMFAQLGRLQNRRDFRVRRIVSRNAGYLEIVTSGGAAGAGDITAEAEEAARHMCEHCGKPAGMIVKVGLEALPVIGNELELGDRLLCVDCSNTFRREIV